MNTYSSPPVHSPQMGRSRMLFTCGHYKSPSQTPSVLYPLVSSTLFGNPSRDSERPLLQELSGPEHSAICGYPVSSQYPSAFPNPVSGPEELVRVRRGHGRFYEVLFHSDSTKVSKPFLKNIFY